MSKDTQLDMLREAANRPPYKQTVYVNAGQLLAEIEREYLPRPRFDDGELVQKGDIIADRNGNRCGHKVLSWSIRSDGQTAFYTGTSSMAIKTGERVKRLQNEVLDADGVPIKVGDTVYYLNDPRPLNVTRVGPLERHMISGPTNIAVLEEGIKAPMAMHSSVVTHKQPDSLERIESDVKKLLSGVYKDEVLDLLRRQREVLERGR